MVHLRDLVIAASCALLVPAWALPARATESNLSAPSGSPGLVRPSAAGDACASGLVYDDGTIEGGVKPSSILAESQYVMRLDPVATPVSIETVCTCWTKTSVLQGSDHDFDVVLYDDDGPGGGPGTLLGRKSVRVSGISNPPQFRGYDVSDLGITVERGSVYVGVEGVTGLPGDPAFCADTTGAGSQPIFSARSGGTDWSDLRDDIPSLRAIGVRASTAPAGGGGGGNGGGGGGGGGGGTEPPPPGAWLTTSELPGFELKVRITSPAGQPIAGRRESRCIPETLCASGALAGRPEIFAKVIGPRPNGFLWVQLSRFTPSRVEVWVRQVSSGDLRYYLLGRVPGTSDDVSGLQDRQAFSP